MEPWSQCDLQLRNLFNKLSGHILLDVFLMAVYFGITQSQFLVKTLPGLQGDLPFKLETGYIGVGEFDDVQLFYYFFESEGNPENDPLMIWLAGGPGCSDLYTILYEIGPFAFNYKNSTLEKPVLEINPHSWTKVANIIFIDQPAGTGFSFAKTPEAYITNDTLSTIYVNQFMRKWLVDHPKFLNNPFYVAGDSYGGIVVPMIAEKIYNGNELGEEPYINIKGYVLGNPATDTVTDFNSGISFAHRMALLSDAIYKSTSENCHGEYTNVDPNNKGCMHDLQVVDKCLERIDKAHVLEPFCDTSEFNTIKYDPSRRSLRSIDNVSMHNWPLSQVPKRGCRTDNYLYCGPWANSREVQVALHIREEFKDKSKWVYCNSSLRFSMGKEPIAYTHNVMNNVPYHRQLTHKRCRALVYSGDHDMMVPYHSTLKWIESLNLLVVNDWRPWFVEEQVAGYTTKYSNHNYKLTFATIKGAGHTAPEFKPKECLSMITKWLANDDL